ncbi:MAG TPA: hypothetical protein VL984_05630 [Acidimicrobiales bacterium]|nr:hypothetical protein [Acidimicrobiales bacterium]
MGKASSSKKVARAAGLGGSRAYGTRPPWTYYFAVVLLVLLGVLGVYNSREYLDNKVNNAGTIAPTVGTTWFEGFAIDECGKLLPPIKTTKDPYGITTKGDGVIYISPKVKSAAGHNATLGKFASSIGMTLNAGEIETPGGRLYQAGDTCEGKPGSVYVMTWSSPSEPQSDGVLQDKHEVNTKAGYEDTCNPDCDSGVLLANDQLVTIAFLPTAAKHKTPNILQPPASVVSKLTNEISTGGTTTTTAPVTPPTTAPATKTTTSAPSTGTSTGTTTTVTTVKPATAKVTITKAKTTTTKASTATTKAK